MYQSTIPCPKCGAQNLRGQWVCAHCGVTLLAYCPACHAGNASDSQFCHACFSGKYPVAGDPTGKLAIENLRRGAQRGAGG